MIIIHKFLWIRFSADEQEFVHWSMAGDNESYFTQITLVL